MPKIKKKRGRKPGLTNKEKAAVASEELNTFPASDFGIFMANFKSEPSRTKEDSEREALIFKINKLKLEIENFKELKALQSLKKTNLLLDIDVLEMKYEKLINDSQNSLPKIPSSMAGSSTDSINIKNVIYNNCTQTKSEASKKISENNSNYDPNFTYIVSQLLSFFSDKMDANFASCIDSIKNYTHQVFKNEIDNIKNETVVSPIVIKSETVDEPEVVTIADNDEEEVQTAKEESGKNDKKKLSFTFAEIKVKILEYLCGKVSDNMVVTAFRRLLKTKAYSMLKQTFDEEHYKLLRIYLFDDGNMLVQDMRKCEREFSKDMYRTLRYYAIVLSAKCEELQLGLVKHNDVPENKKQPESVPDQSSVRPNTNKWDIIVLEPMNDHVARPKFRIDMVQDTMVNEEFELVSSKPFRIRPINTEVWLTPNQLELLKPLVMAAITQHSKHGTPVISITSDNDKAIQEAKPISNLFLLKNDTSSTSLYRLSSKKESNEKPASTSLGSSKSKTKPTILSTSTKPNPEPTPSVTQSNGSISLVSVDDIMKCGGRNPITKVEEKLEENCIDLSDDEDSTIVIN